MGPPRRNAKRVDIAAGVDNTQPVGSQSGDFHHGLLHIFLFDVRIDA